MKFREAIRDATLLALELDPRVFLIGVGVIDPRAVWGTLAGALERFGPDRVVEGPLSELALTGVCVGAAMLGRRPVMIHHRIDFVLLSLDQIVNHAAKWPAMFGGQQRVPMVVRGVVGRGWGNGAQHTSSHHSLFAHYPGLKVVVPASPADAKGLFLAACADDDPVIFIEHRWLHEDDGPVPPGYYTTPIGQASVVRHGDHVTVAAVGPMVAESLAVARSLEATGVQVEVIDLRSLRPLDAATVVASVRKTGRLVVADADWGPCGVASEVVARVAELAFDALKAPPARVVWPDCAVPSSQAIEALFYPGASQIQAAVLQVLGRSVGADPIVGPGKDHAGPF